MNITNFARHHPLIFVLTLTFTWILLLLLFMGIVSAVFHTLPGDSVSLSLARLSTTVCVLLLAWRLNWLKAAGFSRLGSWQVWLLALVGLVYFASASLYSFFGKVAFDFSSLLQLPDARAAVITHFIAGLSEETLFRGLVLYALIRVYGGTIRGIVWSVLLASVLFALVHITQVFTFGASLSSALFLILQVFVLSIWWGALVVMGGSIWPAVLLHFVVNAVVAVQGLSTPMIEPEILAYKNLLWFSLPLGVLATGLLAKTALHPLAPEDPRKLPPKRNTT